MSQCQYFNVPDHWRGRIASLKFHFTSSTPFQIRGTCHDSDGTTILTYIIEVPDGFRGIPFVDLSGSDTEGGSSNAVSQNTTIPTSSDNKDKSSAAGSQNTAILRLLFSLENETNQLRDQLKTVAAQLTIISKEGIPQLSRENIELKKNFEDMKEDVKRTEKDVTLVRIAQKELKGTVNTALGEISHQGKQLQDVFNKLKIPVDRGTKREREDNADHEKDESADIERKSKK
ncbi:hypothetical protein FPQ18DRAFT_301982 [Pyronema domesticum]|nr:hypothetical protein FPQ18DRAFT_301982 [Pyronema domesticum]